MLWQLRKLSTSEPLNEPQELPENWGPIFGLANFEDRLGDLSWLGDTYQDMGWIVLSEAQKLQITANEVNNAITQILERTASSVAIDNTNMTKADRNAWLDYHIALKNIPLQPGFPKSINWPSEPA